MGATGVSSGKRKSDFYLEDRKWEKEDGLWEKVCVWNWRFIYVREWSHLSTCLSNENIKWERTLVYDQRSVIILQMSRRRVSASIVRINKLNNNQLRCVSFVARGSFREDHIKRNCSQKFTKNETLGEEGRERDNFGLMPWRTLHLLLMALLTL